MSGSARNLTLINSRVTIPEEMYWINKKCICTTYILHCTYG